MIALPWIGSVVILATLATPSAANLPPNPPPHPGQHRPITGEAPLMIDADGYVVSISELDEAD